MGRRPLHPGPIRRLGPITARLVVVALATTLLSAATASGLAPVLGPTHPAGADPIGSCTASSGVIVVVDFTPWGGGVQRGCDATLTTGYDALYAAGFTTAGDEHDGPEFVCRIDNKPTPAQDPCIQTPPATAYWSYWHADAGVDTWSYSELGATSYQPQPGSVDAWTFGGTDLDGTGGQPPFPPSAVRATNTSVATPGPTPAVSPPAPAATGSGRNGKGARANGAPPVSRSAQRRKASSGAQSGVSTVPSTDSTTTTEPTAPVTPTTMASADSGTSPAVASAPKIVAVAPTAAKEPSAGSPLPTIVGVAVIATLAVAAGVVAWRRRRMG